MILKNDITLTKCETYCWSLHTSAVILSVKGFRSPSHYAFGFDELDWVCSVLFAHLG